MSPFNNFSSSIPPKLTSEIFHNNNRTFFIGKCRAEPAQNLVIIPNNLTDSNSSPIGASEIKADISLRNDKLICKECTYFIYEIF